MSRDPRRPWAAAVVAAALAVPALTGCSHDSPIPANAPVTKAPPISTKRGQTVPASALANRVSAAVLRAGSARFSVSSTLLGRDLARGSVVTSATDPRLSIATTGQPPLKAVILPGTYYVDPGQPQNGKHWIKLGSVTGSLTLKLVGPLISRLVQSADVSALTGGWAGAGRFTVGPSSRIGAVKVTEYEGSLPRSAVLDGIRSELKSMVQGSITDTRLRVWLDAAGRPIRVSTVASLDGTRVVTTVTYGSWGKGPAIVAPPSSDVLSLPGL
jgi:hypothetical protein